MDKEQIINEIEEIIKYNKAARQADVVELCKDATRKSNDVLAKARNYIKSSDEYERGANDAWALAKRIGCRPSNGGYDCDEMEVIFDSPLIDGAFNKYTYQEALAKVKAYEKKKEEEAAKPKLGDVVEVISNHDGFVEKGIFLSECFDTITYIIADGGVVKASSNHFKFIKTGEHVDIQGMLDKIG